MEAGKCFDKGPEIRVESGNGRRSKWHSTVSSISSQLSINLSEPFINADQQ